MQDNANVKDIARNVGRLVCGGLETAARVWSRCGSGHDVKPRISETLAG